MSSGGVQRVEARKIPPRLSETPLIWIHQRPPHTEGGILTPEARKVLLEWADGYSVCDLCFEGRVNTIRKPPIVEFKQDVAEFLGMDDVRFTAGARHAMFV